MASKNTVLKSINNRGESRCVDVFERPDGTFGFEEFRRDSEDNRGWFRIGAFGERVFDRENDALLNARSSVPWLSDERD